MVWAHLYCMSQDATHSLHLGLVNCMGMGKPMGIAQVHSTGLGLGITICTWQKTHTSHIPIPATQPYQPHNHTSHTTIPATQPYQPHNHTSHIPIPAAYPYLFRLVGF